jgi:hypothetical protein
MALYANVRKKEEEKMFLRRRNYFINFAEVREIYRLNDGKQNIVFIFSNGDQHFMEFETTELALEALNKIYDSIKCESKICWIPE